MVQSYFLGRDWGPEGDRYADELETYQEVVTVIGRYL